MDFDQTCLDFLDHFDRPKTADAVDFNSSESIAFDAPSIALDDAYAHASRHLPTRSAHWVLLWTAAIAVLLIALGGLTQFAYLIAAEHSLNVAARAGATEATLPRATYQSVKAAVERRLVNYPLLSGQLQVNLLQNGTPVGQKFRAGNGDRFSITISVPTSVAMPTWLRKFSPWHDESLINARAESDVPGRKLRAGRS
jgi:hypothetical protein